MGFGLLFIGYFFMLFIPLSELDLLPNLAPVGCVIMFLGLQRLIRYAANCTSFKHSLPFMAALFMSTLASFIFSVIGVDSSLAECIEILNSPLLSLYSIMLFLGIHKLSAEVELPKVSARARRMITLSLVYGLLSMTSGICQIIFVGKDGLSTNILALLHYSDFAAYILEHLFLFMTLALIFTCYMRICLEGDEDMLPKDKSQRKRK